MSAYNELHWRPVTAREAVGPVGGLSARDQRDGFYVMPIKRHERLTPNKSLDKTIRGLNHVGVSAGFVEGAYKRTVESKNARRKRQRHGK